MDRNARETVPGWDAWGSLSARRAWIEICLTRTQTKKPTVALRKESVDRNIKIQYRLHAITESLSARRAWIEIPGSGRGGYDPRVALRKESVDRNRDIPHSINCCAVALRKESVDRNCPTCQWRRSVKLSLSARRAWIEIIKFVNLRVLDGCRSPQGERG